MSRLSAASEELALVRVVLVAARNPLNIGAAARAMSNFGFSRLRVVNPYQVAFREAKSAVGAAELLKSAEECSTVAEAVADASLVVGTTAATNRDLQQPVRALKDIAQAIREHARSKSNIAILFGSEKRGLSNSDLSHCHAVMRIPTREGHPSMNLGQAVAVTLYELVRDRERRPQVGAAPKLAAAAEQERITGLLMDLLTASEYLKRDAVSTQEMKIRRFVRRLNLESDDAELLLGMLRQISWKVRVQG